MKRLRLFITDGSEVVERAFFELPVRIGRHATNDCQILDAQASRFHAQIDRDGDSLVVRDVSRNGTTVVGGVGEGGRILRGEEAKWSGGSLTLVVGIVRVRVELEPVGAEELPDSFVSAARAATKVLLEACEPRGLPIWAGDPNPEILRGVIDALFRNLLQVRTALHPVAPEVASRRDVREARGEAATALLQWTHATTQALRAIELAFERTWPRGDARKAGAAGSSAAALRSSGVRLRSGLPIGLPVASRSESDEPSASSGRRS
jgi:hypothetical protein